MHGIMEEMDIATVELKDTSVTSGQTGSKGYTLPINYPTLIQKYTSVRWRLCYMISFVFMLTMILRNSMSFALVCMTGEVILTKGDNSSKLHDLNTTTNHTHATKIYTGEFQYDEETQGLLISCPFYAVVFGPVIGRACSSRFGPKRVILFFMGVCGIVVVLTPLAARTHLYLLVATRVLVGLLVTTVLPPGIELYLYWAPAEEKPQLLMLSFAGYSVALILLYALSGVLCLVPLDNGWPFIFYFFGTCTLLWCLVWLLTVHDKPEQHPGISVHEKMFIMARRTPSAKKTTKIPWRAILTSKCVWAYIIVFSLNDWNNGIFFGYLPLYMATVLNFDVAQNGLLSALPYASRLVATVLWSYVAEWMEKCFSVTNTRKIMQVSGFGIAAGLSVSLCYLEEGQEYIAVAIFILSTPFQIVMISSTVVTTVDMAPQYASLLNSLGTTGAYLAMMVSPITASYILGDRSRQQWNYIFYLIGGVYVLASLVFLFFGSGELQPWAVEPEDITVTYPEDTRVTSQDDENKKGNTNLGYVPDHEENTKL